MYRYFALFLLCLFSSSQILATPTFIPLTATLERRTYPQFPNDPPSCPVCAKDYPSINSCAEASPVLANFTMIIFNPGAFVDVIKCSCLDTFQAVFPQCVDCFIKTGQENILNTPNLPAVVDGMRKICALESTLLGNVSGDHTYFPSTSTAAPTATPTSGEQASRPRGLSLEATFGFIGCAVFLSLLGS
ncbi:hypothetical protein CPB83DRAFT_853323 [Crepidotus variabilis]|uniref:Uncharacterized protein n=1 Tax=Crepidotus variabilis TaxID=179855 RepID=A0A9P6EGI5_9AGAR|nr:hypothetical protein CPB83DRAFT_853323 [Crepidotus variabilis]